MNNSDQLQRDFWHADATRRIHEWLEHIPECPLIQCPSWSFDCLDWCQHPADGTRDCSCCLCAMCLPVEFLGIQDYNHRPDADHLLAMMHRLVMSDSFIDERAKTESRNAYKEMWNRLSGTLHDRPLKTIRKSSAM